MITELTPEQEAQLEVYAEKWIKIGLSTELANRSQAEKGVWLAYKLVGLTPPQEIVWCDSPQEMTSSSLPPVPVKELVFEYVKESVRYSVRQTVDVSVGASVLNSIGERVENMVGDMVFEEIRQSLPNPRVGGSLFDTVTGRWAVYGYFDYIDEALGLTLETAQLEGLSRIAQNAGWWLPCESICYISERHTTLNLDDQNHPHCEDGLAIGYPDGWGVYAWHGVRVPEWVIIEPEKITPEKIFHEPDFKVSCAMLDRYGIEKFISNTKLEPFQSDEFGDVYIIERVDSYRSIQIVYVKDSGSYQGEYKIVSSMYTTAREIINQIRRGEVN